MAKYYKKITKNEFKGIPAAEASYEKLKQHKGAIVFCADNENEEFILIPTEAVDEFVITALSREDFRSQGFTNPETLSDETMQEIADAMAENFTSNGSYWDDIDEWAAKYGLNYDELES